jgi:two-component system, chemotaxis family, chemotaxis protein CheY
MARTVLLVDDSSTVRIQAGRALTGAGFHVLEAVDGIDGLEKLDANADIALIICDFNMPRMSGIEFVEMVSKRGGAMPAIVMLTTEGNPQLIKRALASGARAWMTKPFKPDLLVAAALKIVSAA